MEQRLQVLKIESTGADHLEALVSLEMGGLDSICFVVVINNKITFKYK